MASHVFLGPIPMKEKILGPPGSCEMATALLETAAGSGLSVGSSSARRGATSKRQNRAESSLLDTNFIAEIIAAKVGAGNARPCREDENCFLSQREPQQAEICAAF